MVYVEVTRARRLEADESSAIALANVILDQCVAVHGVVVAESLLYGGYRAQPPTRRWGQRGPVLSWSGEVARQVGEAVMRQLDGKVAVTEDVPA
jgi:hypothetical protein